MPRYPQIRIINNFSPNLLTKQPKNDSVSRPADSLPGRTHQRYAMKIRSLAAMLTLCYACEAPPTVPSRDTDEADAGVSDLPEICANPKTGECADLKSSGRCLQFQAFGQDQEYCFEGGADGVITIASCDCNLDCVHITYTLLGGGESEACNDCIDRPYDEQTICPPNYEGE